MTMEKPQPRRTHVNSPQDPTFGSLHLLTQIFPILECQSWALFVIRVEPFSVSLPAEE